MFIPVVPSVPRVKVINKTVVYSDTVIKLDSLGKDIKVTSVDNVKENDLEQCIKSILESNEDILFNTIQYSRKDKKVYFYTNKNINLSKWINRDLKDYDRITNRESLLDNLTYLFDSSNRPKDEDIISLYDVFMLFSKTYASESRVKGIFTSRIENILKNKISNSIWLYGLNFDYSSRELTLRYSYLKEEKKIVFSKSGDDVYIVRSDAPRANEVFSYITSIISEAYDELLNFEVYNTFKDSNSCIDVVDSNLKASIGRSYIDLYNMQRNYSRDFDISFGIIFDSRHVKCNSSIVLDLVTNNEEKLFKNAFVKIEDCPEWTKEILYETRKKNLEEEKRIEEERLNAELRAEKIRRIKRFFNPFAK